MRHSFAHTLSDMTQNLKGELGNIFIDFLLNSYNQMLSMVFFKLTCLSHNFFPKSGKIFIFLLLFVIWSMNTRWLRDIGCSQRFEHHESWQGQIFLGVGLCKRRSQKSKDKRPQKWISAKGDYIIHKVCFHHVYPSICFHSPSWLNLYGQYVWLL